MEVIKHGYNVDPWTGEVTCGGCNAELLVGERDLRVEQRGELEPFEGQDLHSITGRSYIHFRGGKTFIEKQRPFLVWECPECGTNGAFVDDILAKKLMKKWGKR